MKILVIGCNGNMGRRYCAILKWLGIEHVGIDIPMPYDWLSMDWDRAIIATPTDTHVDIIATMDSRPWICEKPISRSIGMIKGIALQFERTGYMVCNWKFVRTYRPNFIYYDCYNTGKDGLSWDCIQLIYLAQVEVALFNDTPFFNCTFDLTDKITLDDIQMSYIKMIDAFVQPEIKGLWTMADAVAATKRVLEYDSTHPSA